MHLPEIAITIITIGFLSIVTVILYYKRRFDYWKKRGMPGPTPAIPLGNSQNPFARKSTTYEHVKSIYDRMKAQNYDQCGIYVFMRPAYLPIDPDIIKNIMTRDFAHFVDRGAYYNEKDDPLSAHLLSLEGQKWKNLRAKLTPSFTSGKMKMMFKTLLDCGDQMLEAMQKLSGQPLDIKEVCACYTTDVIGSCAFGLDCNSFTEKESEFRKYGRQVFQPTVKNVLRIVFCSACGDLAKKLGTKLIDPEVSAFFMDVIKKTLKYREERSVTRNDFLQLLMELKAAGELRVDEVAAQSFLFFLAGFETSSTTLTFCMYELAVNAEVQNKVRHEIEEVMSRNGGEITYESLGEMKYLGQVIDETLRKYPSVPMVQRICTKDYKLPNSGTVLEKGTQVFLPIYALHKDPEYYPDPEKFDPERFSDENKSNKQPYYPFGEGPRVCIGSRFGLMQVKIGLIMLIRNYRFSINSATKTPLEFDRNGFLLTLKDKLWLNAKKV